MSIVEWTVADLQDAPTDELVEKAFDLTRRISPLLHGNDPRVTAAALAELLSCLIAGHNPDMRQAVLESTIGLVRARIDPIVEKMITEGCAPAGWRGPKPN